MRAKHSQWDGVVFVGKAQEKCNVYRTEKRHNPKTGQAYAWIVKSTALVNHYYFYCVDENFAPSLRRSQTLTIYRRLFVGGQDRCTAAQVAPPSTASLSLSRPCRRLPLPTVDLANR